MPELICLGSDGPGGAAGAGAAITGGEGSAGCAGSGGAVMAVGVGAWLSGSGGGATDFLTTGTTLGGVGAALGGDGSGARSGVMNVTMTSLGMLLVTGGIKPFCKA